MIYSQRFINQNEKIFVSGTYVTEDIHGEKYIDTFYKDKTKIDYIL